jgi:hypothetical protein
MLWGAAAAAVPSGGGSWLQVLLAIPMPVLHRHWHWHALAGSTSDIANAAISTTKRMHQLLGLNPIPHTETM